MTMLALLALVLAAEPPAARDPEILVARLGSTRYAEREAAANALKKLGRDALPALRIARHDKDAEVQNRAEGLLDTIERGLLTRPTPIALAAGDRTLKDRLKQFSAQTGTTLTLAPGVDPGRHVRFESPGPSTFWEALDRLGLSVWLWTPPRGGFDRSPTLALENPDLPADPTSDTGPFRFVLRDIMAQRGEVNFLIELMAEPRLGIRLSESTRLTEAIDESGRSFLPLVQEPAREADDGPDWEMTDAPGLAPAHIDVPVRLPLPVGRAPRLLKRLRGTLEVIVEARRLEPEVFSVEEAEGRPFWSGESSMIIRGLAPGAAGPPTLELILRPPGWRFAGGFPMRGGNRWVWESLQAETELVGQSFELVDDRGRSSPVLIRPRRRRPPFQFGPEGIHVLFDLTTRADIGDPIQIRHHSLIRTTTELTFEFRDLRLR